MIQEHEDTSYFGSRACVQLSVRPVQVEGRSELEVLEVTKDIVGY